MLGMSEINVIAIFHVKPEFRETLLNRLHTMADDTHANDEGCLLYSLQQSTTDPNVLAFIEKWASEEALDTHGGKPHIVHDAEERASWMSEPAIIVRMRNVGAGTPELGLF